MAPPQQGEEGRRPPPLGLRDLSRLAFQSRSPSPQQGEEGRRPPPLGLVKRAPLPSFFIGTTGFEQVPPPSVLPRRRIGLSRPSRPPAPNEVGSSNWSSSVGGDGTGSGGRSSFVGFSLLNGDGRISFGGSESMGFNFRSGAGGIRIGGIGESSSARAIGGSTIGIGEDESTSNIGYRGKGYNPNFAHAGEYPPSQEHVQIQKAPLDLSKQNYSIFQQNYNSSAFAQRLSTTSSPSDGSLVWLSTSTTTATPSESAMIRSATTTASSPSSP